MTASPPRPHSVAVRSSAPKVGVLGILCFMIGAPHLYGFLKRRSAIARSFNPAPYGRLVLMAGVLAGLVEMSLVL